MIEIDLERQEQRVVEVRATVTDPTGRRLRHTSSGFLVADQLVLTCAHGVLGADTLALQRAGDRDEMNGTVVWPTEDADDGALDVALIEVPGLKEPPGQRPLWGELTGHPQSAEAYGIGFPRAAADERSFHPTPLTGQVLPGEGRTRSRLVFTADSSETVEGAEWAGMSGAMIRDSGGRLLGIAAELATSFVGRFLVVPSRLLLDQPRLRTLLGDPELHPITMPHRLIRPASEPMGEETDFKLLTARFGQVPFVEESHGAVLDDLIGWCEAGRTGDGPKNADVSVRLLLGPGGSGKTRLAAELCHRLRGSAKSWLAGFAREDATAPWDSFQPQQPTLIVVDYVERPAMAAMVIALLSRLDRLGSALQAPVRVLLVSRTTTGWYTEIDDYSRGSLSGRLRVDGEDARTVLSESPFDPELRRLHFTRAFERFADGNEPAGLREWLEKIDDEHYSSPLLIHTAALLAARNEPVPGPERRGLRAVLLDRMLLRERTTRWIDEVALSTTRVGPESSDQTLHAVAIATLTAPTIREAEELLKSSRLWEDQSNAARREAAKALSRLYPSTGSDDVAGLSRIAVIEPDLIAEHLLAGIEGLDELLAGLLECDLTPHHYARMLHILALSCDHFPEMTGHFQEALRIALMNVVDLDDAGRSLSAVLSQSLPRLLEVAARQTADTGTTLVADLLTASLEAASDSEIAEVVATSNIDCCLHDLRLARLGSRLFELAAEHHRRTGDRIGHLAALEGRCDALHRLGESEAAFELWQSIAALRREAVGFSDESLRWSRRLLSSLQAAFEEQSAFGRVLDTSLQILALDEETGGTDTADVYATLRIIDQTAELLCNDGRLLESFRAVRRATEYRSNHGARAGEHRDSLRTLESLGVRMLAAEHYSEAVDATALAAHLSMQAEDADFRSHQKHLSVLKQAVGALVSPDGDGHLPHAIWELAEVRAWLSDRIPALAPVLAEFVEWAGDRLWRRGQRDRALGCFAEAVELRSRLVDSGPLAEMRYCDALADLAVAQWETGQHRTAVVTHRTRLKAADELTPIGVAAVLYRVRVLQDFGCVMWALGNEEDALMAVSEALRIEKGHGLRHDLQRIWPGGRRSPTSGRIGAVPSEQMMRQAVRILERLAVDEPSAALGRARQLHMLAAHHAAAGDNSQVLDVLAEAADAQRTAFDRSDPHQCRAFSVILMDLSESLYSPKRFEESASAAAEAVEVIRGDDPGTSDRAGLAEALMHLGMIWLRLQHYENGMALVKDAFSLRVALAATEPAFLTVHASDLESIARQLAQFGRDREAVPLLEEALRIHRERSTHATHRAGSKGKAEEVEDFLESLRRRDFEDSALSRAKTEKIWSRFAGRTDAVSGEGPAGQ